jgi:hypothetical protein
MRFILQCLAVAVMLVLVWLHLDHMQRATTPQGQRHHQSLLSLWLAAAAIVALLP